MPMLDHYKPFHFGHRAGFYHLAQPGSILRFTLIPSLLSDNDTESFVENILNGIPPI